MSIGLYEKQKTAGFWQIDKSLFAYFKCINTVLILDELLFHKSKHADPEGWFYYKAEYLEKNLYLGRRIREQCFEKLVESGILSREKRGIPTYWYYKIDSLKIDEIIRNVHLYNPECTNVHSALYIPNSHECSECTVSLYNKKEIKEEEEEEEEKPAAVVETQISMAKENERLMFSEEKQEILDFIDAQSLLKDEDGKLYLPTFKQLRKHVIPILKEWGSVEYFKAFLKSKTLDHNFQLIDDKNYIQQCHYLIDKVLFEANIKKRVNT